MSVSSGSDGGTEDDRGSEVTNYQEVGGDICTCCNLSLGTRLRPRHRCDYCDRGVCSSCSFMVQPLGAQQQSRVCSSCISLVEQARSTKERLASIEARLKALGNEASPKPQMALTSSLRRLGTSLSVDRSIEEAVTLVEAAVGAAEEARLTSKLKRDQVDAIARMERARREGVETKAAQAKDSVVELGDRLRQACQACETCIKPFDALDEASNVEAERWAVSLAADRATADRRVKDADSEAKKAKDCLFRLAMRMHTLANPPICPKPQANHTAEDLVHIVERAIPIAVPSINEVMSEGDDRASLRSDRRTTRSSGVYDAKSRGRSAQSSDSLSCCFSRGKSQEYRSPEAASHRSRSGSSDDSRSRRLGQAQSEDKCNRCGTAVGFVGFRRFHRRYHCDICSSTVCGASACSLRLRLCVSCNTAARQGHAPDNRAVRLRRVCEVLRDLGSGSGRHGSSKKQVVARNLDDLIKQCEDSLQPLKDLKNGYDVAKNIAGDVKAYLEKNAQAAAMANVTYVARLKAVLGGEGDAPGGSDPSSASFW